MDKRVQFDFEIEFTNGGGIQGQEFRLDIDGDDITDEAFSYSANGTIIYSMIFHRIKRK